MILPDNKITLLTDKGREFNNSEFKDLCTQLQVNHGFLRSSINKAFLVEGLIPKLRKVCTILQEHDAMAHGLDHYMEKGKSGMQGEF